MFRRGLILLLTVHLSLTGWPVALTLPAAEVEVPAAPTRCPCCVTEESCKCCPKDAGCSESTPARDGKPAIHQCRCSKQHALVLASTQVLLTTGAALHSQVEMPPAGRVAAVREAVQSIDLPPDPPPPRLGQ